MNRELYLNTLACNGCFALEYYLWNELDKDHLIKDGIEYCNHIIDASKEIDRELIITDENKYEILDTIQKYYKIPKILEFSKMAYKVRTSLFDILDRKGVNLSEEKIRTYQQFFNDTSHIFLVGEMRKMRIREELRHKLRYL